MRHLNRIAAVLAFIIGAMAVVAGGQVILGRDPGYNVINWLPLYNYTIGLLSVVIAAPLLWVNHRLAFPAALVALTAHLLTLMILLAAYRDVVALDSLVATSIRIVVWLVIVGLLLLQRRRRAAA
jgi:uncharacterized membrane protein YdcZ (DUF606 family)